MNYRIRDYRRSDLPDLAGVYRRSIRDLAPRYYTTEQIAAWSALGENHQQFRAWIEGAATFVAQSKAVAVGFAGMDAKGHICSLFVAPDHTRQGVGSRLLDCLIAKAASEGLSELTTAASELSRPLFERFGFGVFSLETRRVNGVTFQRYAMSRRGVS